MAQFRRINVDLQERVQQLERENQILREGGRRLRNALQNAAEVNGPNCEPH
jgi:hypothetical protein